MTRDFDLVPALPFPAAAALSTGDNISAALSSIDAAVSALRALAPHPPAALTPADRLVVPFRSSHHCAAPSFANFGIEDH